MSAGPPTLLAIQHVPWEPPHRILGACEGLEVRTVEPLAGCVLPDHAAVLGAVVMGGPMNVDEAERYPQLAEERAWLAEAVDLGMPVLGICLGAQLLARAIGAAVRPGDGAEIGFAPVRVADPDDPVLGCLAPRTPVLHWHGDVFDLPAGTQPLASSEQTPLQAFRRGNAWGILFHPEADAALVDAWLNEPTMLADAEAALGPDAADALRRQAAEGEAELIARSTPGFEAFADLVATRHPVRSPTGKPGNRARLKTARWT